ncbi:hypothetical protein FNV43_RR15498 [Rhamnella rubrinervis]|uniref:3-methyl-2-oxobutanoate hydroxymethyltransferase n=1 Tax=Rhamnella rubrinervis TaxID=2594499 RepID=A0A8K0E8Y6_9ROSA|nr:hypothetical protein FNV43_RR15498 [Rhamnella rubrinervis]
MGHVGLTRQAISVLGGFRPQGKNVASAVKEAGCFAVVLECVPPPVAAAAITALCIPTTSIGAGPFCSVQAFMACGFPVEIRHQRMLACREPSAYPKVASWEVHRGGDCCSWDGVEYDASSGHVIGLNLSSSCLYGSINSTSNLFQLVHLWRVHHVFFCQLGPIVLFKVVLQSINWYSSILVHEPDQINKAVPFRQQVSGLNSNHISNLRNLKYIDLASNNFTDTVEMDMFSIMLFNASSFDGNSGLCGNPLPPHGCERSENSQRTITYEEDGSLNRKDSFDLLVGSLRAVIGFVEEGNEVTSAIFAKGRRGMQITDKLASFLWSSTAHASTSLMSPLAQIAEHFGVVLPQDCYHGIATYVLVLYICNSGKITDSAKLATSELSDSGLLTKASRMEINMATSSSDDYNKHEMGSVKVQPNHCTGVIQDIEENMLVVLDSH